MFVLSFVHIPSSLFVIKYSCLQNSISVSLSILLFFCLKMDLRNSMIWFVFMVCLLRCGWRFLNWIWLTPKKLEKCLREQGFAGNPYRLYSGDLNDVVAMEEEAKSKPMNFSHDIVPRVIPSMHHTIKKYGNFRFLFIFIFISPCRFF